MVGSGEHEGEQREPGRAHGNRESNEPGRFAVDDQLPEARDAAERRARHERPNDKRQAYECEILRMHHRTPASRRHCALRTASARGMRVNFKLAGEIGP